ncbi:MAG: hypothetical protein ACREU8_07630 [Gammaproteobacteria bacterium]
MDQSRRYHAETPEVMVPEMLFAATEGIGFAYGVTWKRGAQAGDFRTGRGGG